MPALLKVHKGKTPASPCYSSGPTLTRCQHVDCSTFCLQFRDPSSPTPARFMPAETCQLQWGQKNPCCRLQTYCCPPCTLQDQCSAKNLASATLGEDLLKKGDDNQIGYKQETCCWSLRTEPGNTLESPPPWEGTAAPGFCHNTALSDKSETDAAEGADKGRHPPSAARQLSPWLALALLSWRQQFVLAEAN